jgi:hypothetical protein
MPGESPNEDRILFRAANYFVIMINFNSRKPICWCWESWNQKVDEYLIDLLSFFTSNDVRVVIQISILNLISAACNPQRSKIHRASYWFLDLHMGRE